MVTFRLNEEVVDVPHEALHLSTAAFVRQYTQCKASSRTACGQQHYPSPAGVFVGCRAPLPLHNASNHSNVFRNLLQRLTEPTQLGN